MMLQVARVLREQQNVIEKLAARSKETPVEVVHQTVKDRDYKKLV